MTNENNLSQNEVAGFLLGLGIGLVVGLLFQPKLAVGTRGRLQNGGTKARGSVTRRPQPYSSVASPPGSQAAESMAS
jgi:hypothetical protein